MSPRSTLLVDVDVLAVAVRREQLDAEFGQKRMQPRLIGSDPLASELVRLPADLGVPEPSTDPVARLQHDDVAACGGKRACRSEPGDAGADDRDVGLDQAGVDPWLPSAAAAARPVRTAPSM